MKKIYEFKVSKIEQVDETKKQNIDGEEVEVTKKVEKSVEHKFFVKSPGRNLKDEAQLFYCAAVTKALKAGLMSVTMLSKRYSNDDGIYSEKEKSEIDKLQEDFKKTTDERIEINKSKKKTKDQKAREEELDKEISAIGDRIIDFSIKEQGLYANTAEVYAQNQTIMYWIAFLCQNSDETPYFGTGSFNERVDKYDEIEESDDDPFSKEVINKFTFVVAFWAQNPNATATEFDTALESLEK
jgi:hypothetical protein